MQKTNYQNILRLFIISIGFCVALLTSCGDPVGKVDGRWVALEGKDEVTFKNDSIYWNEDAPIKYVQNDGVITAEKTVEALGLKKFRIRIQDKLIEIESAKHNEHIGSLILKKQEN